ncbi:MAG: hypothetical protein ACLQDY_12835 [Streptosporangiaceae bacterium]
MTERKRRPRAPSGLDAAGRALWASVTSGFVLNAGELAVLGQACRCADVLERLDEALAGADVTVEGSAGQPRAHPLLAASAEQRKVFDALVRSLALPQDGEQVGRRMSPQQAAAARTRWQRGRAHGDAA